MFNSNLTTAVENFARLILPLTEKDLEREWKWKDHDEEGILSSVSYIHHLIQEEIKKEVLLHDLVNGPHDKKAYDVEKEFDLAPQKKIWVGVKK